MQGSSGSLRGKEAEVKAALRTGNFTIKPGSHAQKRMLERGVFFNDIKAAGHGTCVWDESNQSYQVKGRDLRGRRITVGVMYFNHAVIVTVIVS